MEDLSEKYIPICEPWLSEWCILQSYHLVALDNLDLDLADERKSLIAACYLADAKYEMYLDSIKYAKLLENLSKTDKH